MATLLLRDSYQAYPIKAINGWYNVRASTEVNRVGMLTASILLTEFIQQGYNTASLSLPGDLVIWPAFSDWLGFITMATVRNGVLEIVAESALSLLKKKLIALPDYQEVTPGTVLVNAVATYNNILDNRFQLFTLNNVAPGKFGYVDRTSRNISIAANPAVDFYEELLPMLTDDMNMEISIDNFYVTYAQTIGTDRSASVVLRGQQDGGCITSYSMTTDLYSITNEMRGIGLEKTVTKSAAATGTQRTATTRQKPAGGTKATVQAAADTTSWTQTNYGYRDATSVRRWSPLQERRDYPFVRSKTAMERRLKTEIDRIGQMYPTIELDIVNIGNIFTTFALGDTVTVSIAAGASIRARVMVRTYDETSGVMTLALRAVAGI